MFDLDVDVHHCEGCQALTGNPWLLCTRCTAMETDDKDWHRGTGHVDPNGVRA